MKILAVAGASGGHIFPAVSFLDAFKKEFPGLEAILVLPRQNSVARLEKDGFAVEYISVSNFGAILSMKSLKASWNFLKGVAESFFILSRFRPDIVVGFGSIASVPIIFWAWIFRVKTLLHEQNVLPGKANRLMINFCEKIAVSFEETRNYLGGAKDKAGLTGNPIRSSLKRRDKQEALKLFGLNTEKFTILIMGGSSGSHRINLLCSEVIIKMQNHHDIQFIHLSGPKDYEFLQSEYKEAKLSVKLFGFLEEMDYAYSAADLAICRAGATTLSEIIYYLIPAIIIPYPFAYQHQMENARVLKDKGAASILDENDLNAEMLKEKLEALLNNRSALAAMSSAYNNFAQDNAAGMLVRQVVELAEVNPHA